MIISEKEKRNTAIHEAGHALRRASSSRAPIRSTRSRSSRAAGRSASPSSCPPEDRLNIYQEFALDQIAILMGGRLAEEIIFSQKTTGAGERHRARDRTSRARWSASGA